MSIMREMREQGVASTPERSILWTVLIGCVAFAIGAAAILGWKMWLGASAPQIAVGSANQPNPQTGAAAAAAPVFAGNRLGDAEHAPLLRTCIKPDISNDMDPQAFYRIITLAGTASTIGSLVNPKEFKNGGELAVFWDSIAECVFQQNSWTLCDPNNRQLAVTSASAAIREGAKLAETLKGRAEAKSSKAQQILALNARAHDQVLDGLRTRLRNGYLIAADFTPPQPTDVRAILEGTKTIANGCAKQ